MFVRQTFIAVALMAAAYCGFVGLGAWASTHTSERLELSLQTDQPETAQSLQRAALDQFPYWTGATLWHPGALEALGWGGALIANQTLAAADLEKSVQFTEKSLQMAPANSAGWLRLSTYAAIGSKTGCDVLTCYQRSLATAPMGVYPTPLACDQVRMGIFLNEITSGNDLSVRLFLYSKPGVEKARYCLSGLSEADIATAIAFLQRIPNLP
jgi:hypothetical protein